MASYPYRGVVLSTACVLLAGCGASGAGGAGAPSAGRAPSDRAAGAEPVAPAPVTATGSAAQDAEPDAGPSRSPSAPDAATCMLADVQELLACDEASRDAGSADPEAARDHARAGEAAWQAKDMARCTEQFEHALSAHRDAEDADGWALRALRCRLESRIGRRSSAASRSDPARPPQPLDADAAALDAAARRVVCILGDDTRAGRGLYWMAHLRMDAARYVEAATLFDAIVSRDPDSEHAGHAAVLAIEVLQLRTRQRPAATDRCLERMGELAPRYDRALCADGSPARWESECETLGRVQCTMRRRAAERMAEERLHAEASAAFEELARDAQCGGQRTDELLFNAAHLAERAGDGVRARSLRDELRNRFPDSPLLRP